MALFDWVPKYIKQVLNRPPRYKVTAEEYNELFNLLIEQGDYNAATLKELLTKLQIELWGDPVLHKHDERYYTKPELDRYLQGGDTVIKVEVFEIVSGNLGDGTFSYKDSTGTIQIGSLDALGNQQFSLQKGSYEPGQNRIEAIINDTLVRSVVSGGLTELTNTTVQLNDPQAAGAEITFKYFERIGFAPTNGIVVSKTNPGGNMLWCQVVE
jgi:hypothetical protein